MSPDIIRPTGKDPERRFQTRVRIGDVTEEFVSSENTLRTNLYVTILLRLQQLFANDIADPVLSGRLKAERLAVTGRLTAALDRGETSFHDEHVDVDFTETTVRQSVPAAA